MIAGGELEEGLAVTELLTAARFITNLGANLGRRPRWRKKLRRAVADGKARPHETPSRNALLGSGRAATGAGWLLEWR